MKHICSSILLMAVAVMTACQKEHVENEPAVEKTPYVYSVKAGISTDESRTDYDATGKFSWTAGDQISVLFNDGSANKFFTLTTAEGGETATFTGTIDAGYEIGALDGAEGDLKIWALYPASENHSYAEGTPSFYVKPQVDFTETGFSANIPMYDLLTEEGDFAFKNLASTYKFIVKDLDSSIEKVKFVVYNQETWGLSGSWPIHAGEIYLNYAYATPGSEKSTLTFVGNVTEGQSVFYVPTRYWGDFQPVVRVYDADTDELLKEVTAGKSVQPKSFTKVPQIAISVSSEPKEAVIEAEDVAVKVSKSMSIGATTNSTATIEYVSGDPSIATVSSDGTVTGVAVGSTTITLSVAAVEGKYTAATKTINVTVSAIVDIDGVFSDWEDVEVGYTNESNNYRVFKAAYDKDNIYLYTKRVTVDGQRYIYYEFDLDNNPETGVAEGSRIGLEAYMALVIYSGDSIVENPGADSYYPNSNVYDGVVCKGTVGADFTETELSIPRSNLNIKAGDTIKIYSWGNKSADGVAFHPLVLSIEI